MRQSYLAILLLLLSAFTTGAQVYCPVSFPGGVSAITEVQFGTMTNASAASSTVAHESFTTVPDTLYNGVQQLIVKGTTGGNFTDTVMAYFDWNQDWDFTDPGESYYVGTITNSAGSNLTEAAITVVTAGPNPGYIRMRIIKARAALPGSCNAAGIGQAEDYNVYLVPGPPCSGTPVAGIATAPGYVCPGQPFALSVTGYSATSFHFYQWEESPQAQSTWTSISGATTPTYIVQGTTSAKDYRLIVTCANAGAPDITNTVTVNTTYSSFTQNTPVCVGGTVSVTIAPCPVCTVSVAGPGGFTQTQSFNITNAGLQHEGWYLITTSGNGCIATDSVYIDVSNCQDSVWPGDANHDLITNYLDALELAAYHGQTGVVRPGATTAYTGQACPDWPAFSVNSVNLKHADCNGDGTIDLIDTLPIHQHYNIPHLKGAYTPRAKISSVPELYFDTTGIQFVPNSWVSIPLMLGTSSFPMMTLLGIASEIKFSGFSLTQPLHLTHGTSWLGFNTMNFKESIGNQQLDFVHALYNHTTASGYGAIGDLQLFIPPGTLGDTGLLYLDNEVLIDGAGNVLTGYNLLPASFVVKSPLSVPGQHIAHLASIVPNPSAAAELVFTTSVPSQLIISISDITGRRIWQSGKEFPSGHHTVSLPGDLPAGVYIVRITAEGGKAQTLKWLKR